MHISRDTLQVFNFTSGSRNPVLWQQFLDAMVKIGFNAPPSKALWYYCLFTIKSYRLHRLAVFLLHTIPALLMDLVSSLMGKKRRYNLIPKIQFFLAELHFLFFGFFHKYAIKIMPFKEFSIKLLTFVTVKFTNGQQYKKSL